VQEEGAKRLELLAPLFYIPAPELVPFRCGAGPQIFRGGECLFCFSIDEAQGRSIEPDPSALLGPLTVAGRSPPGCPGGCSDGCSGGAPAGGLDLPRGRYLFAQERAFLGREAVIRLAVEMQKDGLWERLRLENRLYLRCLYEDGAAVTQLFRPYSACG
jgi:hypothetical protein